MKTIHTFVVLAYKESQYLEECIKSVLNQKYKSNVVIATTTDNKFIRNIAKKYNLEVIVGKHTNIGGDFDFAVSCGNTDLVTVAHQDDVYDYKYSEKVVESYKKNNDSIILFTDYYEIRGQDKIYSNINLKIKRILLLPLKIKCLSKYKLIKRIILSFGNSICCPAVTFVKDNCPKEIFSCDFKCNVDWFAWEKLSKEKGKFIFIKDKLMGHRISEESTTTDIINNGIRTKEDLVMYNKFWPTSISKLLNKFYKNSEISNSIKKKEKKHNNFGNIKLIAALLVIFSHTYPVVKGVKALDPLEKITDGYFGLGYVAVKIFLFISGYFISLSLLKNDKFKVFFKKRVTRIMLPLIICVFFTTFILGPMFTNNNIVNYFSSLQTYLYFIKNSLLITTHYLPGVFINNPYYLSVNASLWTLPVEFLCYIVLFIVCKLKMLNKKFLKYTIVIVLIIYIFKNNLFNLIPLLEGTFSLFVSFYIGVLYQIYLKNKTNKKIFILVIILTIISFYFKVYDVFTYCCLPYIIYYMGNIKKVINLNLDKYTYEIYLVSFPIQQIIYSIIGYNFSIFGNFVLSLICIIPISILLNKIVFKFEKKFIK